MKTIFYFAVLVPCLAAGMNLTEQNRNLDVMAKTNGAAYLESRQMIVEAGTAALPGLAEASQDMKRTWQQRLAARICYEHIFRIKEIDQLRQYNWLKDPGYDGEWRKNIMGPDIYLGRIVVPHCVKVGLWYYYVELNWKETREYSLIVSASFNKDIWAGWCAYALKGQPEEYYLPFAMIDRVEADFSLADSSNLAYYKTLLKKKNSDAVPLLVKSFAAFTKRAYPEPELYPGINAATCSGVFDKIMSFADSRHADLIEKFIVEHPSLAPLKEKVAEIRKRPAPPPRVEPPFRLGQRLVNP